MPNILLQDLTAMIHHTSRFNGNQFDMVHVETLLQTDVPLTPEMQWYIPTGTSVPDYLAQMLRVSNVAMYPMSAEYVDSEVNNIRDAAKQSDIKEVTHDSSLLMLQAIMKPQPFVPVAGSSNLYQLAYDYKLFPNAENPKSFDFKVVLPFHGLGMPAGSRVQMAIILPITANLDAATTQGVAINGQVIEELTQDIPNCQRKIVSFSYQNDPQFTVRYVYP